MRLIACFTRSRIIIIAQKRPCRAIVRIYHAYLSQLYHRSQLETNVYRIGNIAVLTDRPCN